MMAVAVGWQVYELSGDPLDLGLIGLAEFLPLLLLALPAGQLADHVSRRRLYAAAIVGELAVALVLLVLTLRGPSQVWPFFALAFVIGVAGALGAPASRAITPTLVPTTLLTRALALRSVAFQVAAVSGPAVGGLLFAIEPVSVYAVAAALCAAAAASVLAMRERGPARSGWEGAPGLSRVLGGVRFIRHSPVLLGAISLDLVAVLLGGAVALLPVFAQDVLHVGPVGLGILRSAPAVGALLAAVALTRRPVGGAAGRKLLVVVGLFGASMVVFGLSRSLWLSVAALAAGGAVDMVSVNLRLTLVALVPPDELRGRVTAVEMVFISASNELGAFESGLAAAVIGAVPAVVAGGLATIGVALLWARLFPALARVDRLESLRPAPD
jgi:transmembrane secretion effector